MHNVLAQDMYVTCTPAEELPDERMKLPPLQLSILRVQRRTQVSALCGRSCQETHSLHLTLAGPDEGSPAVLWQISQLKQYLAHELGPGSSVEADSIEVLCRGEVLVGDHTLYYIARQAGPPPLQCSSPRPCLPDGDLLLCQDQVAGQDWALGSGLSQEVICFGVTRLRLNQESCVDLELDRY